MVSAKIAVAGVLGITLILVGVSFIAFGLASALTTFLGLAGGAAMTGLLLLLPPLLWALALGPSPSSADVHQPTGNYESLWITELSRLAQRKPLLAVVVAVVAGAANGFFRKTDRPRL